MNKNTKVAVAPAGAQNALPNASNATQQDILDAARYRWLRTNNIVTNVRFHFASGESPYLYAEALDEAIDHNMGYDPLADAQNAEAIRNAALEEAALLCEAVASDKYDQYKGRGKYAPNNPHRADTYTSGESDGADLCADKIRALQSGTATTKESNNE